MVDYDKELTKLITNYKQILKDHETPIDMTTKEQWHLDGGDARLKFVIRDLNEIVKLGRDNDEETDRLLYHE
jgi:hypothetical protein